MHQELTQHPRSRRGQVLAHLGIATSSWHHRHVPREQRRRPGPAPKCIPAEIEQAVLAMARANPWYGYQRIAVMCRRKQQPVKNRQCYQVMKRHGLLQRKPPRQAEIYQAAKLWELLPKGPNDLWQMDVTYVHIPGHGWWYAVTVIDYYSRYLLALHLTNSYSALEATVALDQARQEAQRCHGPLTKPPFLVTDNGSSFLARRFVAHLADQFTHVRIAYRTPTQLGLLERFHQTLKREEVYWQLYDSPAHARQCLAAFRQRYNQQRPHWALLPENDDPNADPLTPEEVYQQGLAIRLPRWQAWARKAKEKLDQMLTGNAA